MYPGHAKTGSPAVKRRRAQPASAARRDVTSSGFPSSVVRRLLLLGIALLCGACSFNRPLQVRFDPPPAAVDAYDHVEIAARITLPSVSNCFTGATLDGTFQNVADGRQWRVGGFCDSTDGSVFRIRFMPPASGDYRYFLEYTEGAFRTASSGVFRATSGHRRGPIRVDRDHPWHFVWEGTGEHYFFNGTTAYWLAGWKDEQVIQDAIDRLHRLKINRLRVTLAGRTTVFYGEPVMAGGEWTSLTTAWPAGLPESLHHPQFDYTRFDLSYWRKFERMLQFARDRDMVVSVVLDMRDSQAHPDPASGDERRFIHYAVNRLSAFSNVTWDLGDDLDAYRTDAWTHDTGTLLKRWDPYRHLATSHPIENAHQDRRSDWFDFTSFQEWSRTQHAFMLAERQKQAKLGRIIPQTNEEYGYEDHYPSWAPHPPGDSADTLRRTAWDIVMAGGYQTTGESARRGTNIWPDTGGGWINGRGDDTMTMLEGYAHMVDFFTSFAWWETEPHDELVSGGNYCLAAPGRIYAIYLPKGGVVTASLAAGRYRGTWFGAANGKTVALPDVAGGSWTSPPAPGDGDWALLLVREGG